MTGTAAPELTSRWLLRDLFARQRRRVLLGAAGWSGHQVCEAMVPVAIGLAIDDAVRTSQPTALVLSVVGIFALFVALTACWRAGAWQLTQAVLQEAHRLRSTIIRRVLSGAGIETDRSSGELLSIATSDAKAAAEVLETGSRAAAAMVGLTVSAVVLLRIDWLLGLGVLIMVPLLVFGLNAIGPWVQRRTERQQQAVGLAAGTAADLLGGLRPLRGFGGGPEAARRYRDASGTSLRAQVGALRAEAGFTGATTFTTGILLALVAGVAGWFALSGRISIGELITVVGLGSFLVDPVLNLSQCVLLLATGRASAGRLVETLNAPVRAAGGTLSAGSGVLELDGVSAGPLRELDLRVEAGETVGLVSADVVTADTLTQLLAGTQQPDAGTVRLGGLPLAEVTLVDRHRQLLVEPHHVDLFGDSVRDALAGTEAADPVAIPPALEAAAVGHLADDLDHRLLDHGVNLSGGQRQRLALARALLADRPVLVLRDPTTAVDAVTEDLAAEGIRTVRGRADRATVIIATSPPLLSRCDRVIFLSPTGAIHGSHVELLERPDYATAVLR